MTNPIPVWVDDVLTPFDKLDAHRLGLRHKAVSVFVLQSEKMLLQRRALGKYHTPGLWANTCCTHPDWEEASVDCAVRRLKEELGITGLTPEFRHNLEYRADVGNELIEHEVVDVFVAEAPADISVTPNPDEVMATRWVDFRTLREELSAMPDNFTPWLKIYMTDYCDHIFGASAGGAQPG
ncbi:MAG: isopentenyl-diphosphate delta-isomerase [Tateyamaria sp.]